MTAPNFPACLDMILQSEGGFTTSLKDGTVATNMGITLATLSTWLGRPASVAEVKALTIHTACQIYRRNYWDAVCGDQLPAGLDLMVFDCAVNQGTRTAIRILQDSLSVTKDGVIGPAALAAVAHANIPKLIDRIVQLRADFYHRLMLFPLYGAGWMARLYRTAALAHGMVAPVAPTPAAPQEAPLPDPAPTPATAPLQPPAVAPAPVTTVQTSEPVSVGQPADPMTVLAPMIAQTIKEVLAQPITVTNLVADAKPFLQSRTVWGIAIAGAATAAHSLGYTFARADQVALINDLSDLVTTAGLLLAMLGRIMASKPLK